MVLIGQVSTAAMMIAAAVLALWLSNAVQLFQILLQIGAGTGLLFILRWFWWRINAISEIVAMVVSFLVAFYFQFVHAHLFELFNLQDNLQDWHKLLIGVGITTVCWVSATFLTRATDFSTLRNFCVLVNPGGGGWRKIYAWAESAGEPIVSEKQQVNIPAGIICMLLGCLSVYGALFATGMIIYGRIVETVILAVIACAATFILFRLWGKISPR